MRIQKLVMVVVAALFCGLSVANDSVSLPGPSAAVNSVNSIAAVVNDDVVLTSELNAAIAEAKSESKQAGVPLPGDAQQISQTILKQLIYNKLQLQLAKRMKVTVSDEDVTNAISSIAARQNISVDQLKTEVESRGMGYEAFKDKIKDQVIVSKLQQQAIGHDVSVSAQDEANAKTVLQEKANSQIKYDVVDVLIALPSSATEAQIAAANKTSAAIQKQLQQPDVSLDDIKGADVNDLGWVASDALPSIFLDKLKDMKSGQVSKAIQAGNGIHILKLVGRKGSDVKVTNKQVQDLAYQMQFNKELTTWLKKLYSQSYIQIMTSSHD